MSRFDGAVRLVIDCGRIAWGEKRMIRLFVHFVYSCARRPGRDVRIYVYHLASRVDRVSIHYPHDTRPCEARGTATAALHVLCLNCRAKYPSSIRAGAPPSRHVFKQRPVCSMSQCHSMSQFLGGTLSSVAATVQCAYSAAYHHAITEHSRATLKIRLPWACFGRVVWFKHITEGA
jgi:hypothetical protein